MQALSTVEYNRNRVSKRREKGLKHDAACSRHPISPPAAAAWLQLEMKMADPITVDLGDICNIEMITLCFTRKPTTKVVLFSLSGPIITSPATVITTLAAATS